MSFFLSCCVRVELEEKTPVVKKRQKGSLESRTVVVEEHDPIPIPTTIAVKVQPEYSSSYQSFKGRPGIPDYNSCEESTEETD